MIRDRANAEARATAFGRWAVALHALADAADWCDAHRGRTDLEDLGLGRPQEADLQSATGEPSE